MNQTEFKVVLIGDGAVGKSAFVEKHTSGAFLRKYFPTIGVNVVVMDWWTTKGKVDLKVWDTAGQEKFGALRDAYYIGGDAGIIMFDVTSRITYKNVPNWYRDMIRVCENIPIVIVGNKVDVKDRKVAPKHITFHRKKGLQYYDISVRSNFNYEKPFIYLLRKLMKDEQLQLTQQPAIMPPDLPIDMEKALLDQLELETRAAAIPVCVEVDDDF
eukprot:TRINITY_DN5844_c0_g1_i1.p1 TRINITY_DN5844_c0_g1~~TRINITY_DN5844_c0_g1_i1.p1  ORF type:complete len:214 (+),score=46.89 TRINITY_DN5844_c0_g1_i1:73-714(+)